MRAAAHLLLQVWPWLPVGFLLEVAAFQAMILVARRRNHASAPQAQDQR